MTDDPARPSLRPSARPDRPGPPRPARHAPAPCARRPRSPTWPGVDPDWADAFVMELRLADVPGRTIGDALVEVGSHCAESGETASEALGDPVPYARSLDLPGQEPPELPVGGLVPWAVQAVGLLLLTTSFPALRSGHPVDLTTGDLTVAGLLVASMAALGRWSTPVLRAVAIHPFLTWLAMMGHVAVLVGVFLLLDGVVARVPGALAVAVGAAALLVGTAWALVGMHRDRWADDPITTTLAPERPTGPAMEALRYGAALLAPAAAVLLVAVDLLTGV